MRAVAAAMLASAACGRSGFELHDARVIDAGGDASVDAIDCSTCASGLCGTQIVETFQAMPTDWNFTADAHYDSAGQRGVLTDVTAGQGGDIIYRRPLIADDVTIHFEFQITAGPSGNGDGMGFMLETDGPSAIGNNYAGLGISKLTGYGFELDTFNNGVCGDTSDHHVGIDTLATCTSGGEPTSLTTADTPVAVRDGAWHAYQVTIAGDAASVAVDGTPLISSYSVAGLTADGPYYFGFGGSNGGNYDGHAIRNVTISFATTHCL